MNKRIKILVISLVFLLISLVSFNVNAETYNGRLYELYHPDSGFTVFAEEDNRNMDYNSWIIKSTIDSRIYYCIDPAIPLEGALKGSHRYIKGKYNIINSSKFTESKYEKVRNLAFYGYSYKDDKYNHTDKKWYGITQVMIWRVMRPDLNWTFKSNREATPSKTLYSKEVKEMETLIKNHDKVSSFSDKKFNILLGEELTIKDTNKVLSNFSLTSISSNLTIKKNDNEMVIKANKQGTSTIYLSRKTHTNKTFAFLKGDNYQDIIAMGIEDLPNFNFKVTVTGGTLNLEKLDFDSKTNTPSGEASLSSAEYKIYNEKGELVKTITTDKQGKSSIILDYGKYTLKESKAPQGYNLDEKEYNFELNKDNTVKDIKVYDEVIKGQIIITKTKGGTGEKYTKEEGAVFEIYNSNNDLIDTLTTNEEGIISTYLPYGNYKIKQIKGKDGYVISEEKEVSIKLPKTYEINIKNKKLSRLEITKKDIDTKEKISDTIFEIYNSNNEKIFEGSTNKDGKLIVEGLLIDKYYIKEKKASKYYIDSKDIYYFEITDNGKIEKLNIFNKRKTGNLVFYKIDSITGKKLSNSYIKIVSQDTNEIVYKGKTDSNGYIRVNNLRAGTYCISEEKAPLGYQLTNDKKCFEIDRDKEEISVSMTNDKLVKVPNTFKNETKVYIIIGICLIVFSLVYIIYVKHKK